MEKISVIITCYNLENEIERALRAVDEQTYPDLEVIVVDDGSEDKSLEVIRGFVREALSEGCAGALSVGCADSSPGGRAKDRGRGKDRGGAGERIREYKVIERENGGPGAARNAGIEAATGTLIGFVDGDDLPHPEMYEVMEKCLRKTGADVAVCAHESVEGFCGPSTGSPSGAHDVRGTSALRGPERSGDAAGTDDGGSGTGERVVAVEEMDTAELLRRLTAEDGRTPIRNAVWNKLYRRELIGDIRFGIKQYYEDILFTVRVLSGAKKAVFVDKVLYTYIADREASIMNRGVNGRILTEQIPAYEEKSRILREAGYEELADTHDYIVCTKLLQLYSEAVKSSDPEKKACAKPLEDYLKGKKEDFYKIFSVPMAKDNQRLRMQLFLSRPMLYNIFTALSEARQIIKTVATGKRTGAN